MKIGNTNIKPEDVTTIYYNKEEDLIRIYWRDNSKVEYEKSIGPNASGLMEFIQEYINIIKTRTKEKIDVCSEILGAMK